MSDNEAKLKKKENISNLINVFRDATKEMPPTLTESLVDDFGCDPYLILISCLLSLRNRDASTLPICRKLFKVAKTPEEILAISVNELETMIFSIGFYRNKAKLLHSVSRDILDRFGGKVPQKREDLLSIKGVGLKTTNLVLGMAFNIPAICVDVHVDRISNNIGLVQTKTPEETEQELMKILPKENWIEWNKLLVTWGQRICTPTLGCDKCKPLYDAVKQLKRYGV